jgi:PKHD-type hydroxylase
MANSNQSTLWAFEADHVQNWAHQDTVFTKTECEIIIALGESMGLQESTLASEPIDSKIRESKVAWFFPRQETTWIFDRLSSAALNLNNQFFKFDLYGMVEGIQFTKYQEPSGHYGTHIDKVVGDIPRKLSLTIQLSDPESYEGGDLNLFYSSNFEAIVPPKEQGKLIAFPSYMLHQVTPVTKGTRYSLVCWVTGKPFK